MTLLGQPITYWMELQRVLDEHCVVSPEDLRKVLSITPVQTNRLLNRLLEAAVEEQVKING